MINKIHAKAILKTSFISIEENYKSYGQQPILQIYCIPSGMYPLTFYKMKEYKLCLLVVWYEPTNTNLTTTTDRKAPPAATSIVSWVLVVNPW
jgi:hypothetical protein